MRVLYGGHIALGASLGMSLTVLLFLLLDTFSKVLIADSTLWAAVLGAVVGGGISLAGQLLESHARAEQRIEEIRQNDIGHIYSLFVLLSRISGTLRTLRNHTVSSRENADRLAVPYRAIGVIELSGVGEKFVIPTQDLIALIRLDQQELYNQLYTIDQWATNLMAHFHDLQLRRRELLDLFDGDVGDIRKIAKGKEVEAEGRHKVLDANFDSFVTEADEVIERIKGCIASLSKLINSLGNEGFAVVQK